jgi:colanic acid/amylovoran biosynthesis glycosyltransferase
MKIAFIVSRFPALSETFILNQITGLLDMGHDVEIFAEHKSEDRKMHPDIEKYRLEERTYYSNIPPNRFIRFLKAIYLVVVNFHRSPLKILKSLNIFNYGRSALSLRLFYRMTTFLNTNFDMIHCHFGPNGIIGVYLKKIGVKGKIVTTFHGYDMSAVISSEDGDVYKKLFLYGDLFLPISDYWGKKLKELSCDEKKIIVHRMGINIEKFKYSERKIQLGETVKILTIGRLVEKKGHGYAIKAIAKVVAKHENIIFNIAGDGDLRNKLESLVSELEIKKYVKFLGKVEQNEVLELYRQSHFFILSSVTANNGDQEGIPVVLMEAQAIGLPVISTYHSGIPEVVIDGKSGFLVHEKDVDALAEKIEYLIEHPELWSEIGREGRKFVEERYDIKKLNQKLVEIYQALVGKR